MASATGAPSVDLLPLLKTLKRAVEHDEFEDIINASDAVLAVSSNDEDALKSKCVALIQNNNVKEALEFIDKLGSRADKFSIEHAYALYRSGRTSDALLLLEGMARKEVDEGVLNLMAQTYYKQGDFVNASKIYDSLLSKSDTPDLELVANAIASFVSGNQPNQAIALMKKMEIPDDQISYEVGYNLACALLDLGELRSSQKQLEDSLNVCHAQMQKNDMTEMDVEDECAVLLVQQGYVAQLLEQHEQAREIYHKVIASKPSSLQVAATASNNLLSLRNPQEKMFESLHKIEHALNADEEKLSFRQKQALQVNKCLLLLHSKKTAEAKELLQALVKKMPGHEVLTIVHAFSYFKEKNFGKCEQILKEFIDANPSRSLTSRLTLAQVPLSRGNVQDAITMLLEIVSDKNTNQSYSDFGMRPAVIATFVALYERIQDVNGASDIMDKAVSFWKSKAKADKSVEYIVYSLEEKSAEMKLRHNKNVEAISLLENLVQATKTKTGDNDSAAHRRFCAQLVLASAADNNLALSKKYFSLLPALPEVDAEALEKKGFEKSPSASSSASRKPKMSNADDENENEDANTTETTNSIKSMSKNKDKNQIVFSPEKLAAVRLKKQMRKKRRVPKNVDPKDVGYGKPLPEGVDEFRWRPKWQRPSFKKNKSRSKKDQFKGAQGSTTEETKNANTISTEHIVALSGDSRPRYGKGKRRK